MDAQAEEPSNPNFHLPRAPTVTEKEAQYVPQKFNFAEVFDRPLFQGKTERKVTYANGTVKKNRDGSNMTEVGIRTKGEMEDSYMKKNGLSVKSHPIDFVEAFLPFKDNKYSSQKKELVSMKQLTQVHCADILL